MSTFDGRKQAEEAKYTHDQEFRFKVNARRNKLLGLWAAELMGIDGPEADAYAKEVVQSDFERPGDSDVLEKVLGDLTSRNIDMDERRVRKQMDRLLEEAQAQVTSE